MVAWLQVVLWCVSLPKATNAAAAALGVLTACAAAAPLQEQLVGMAALAPVFTRMLQCAPSPPSPPHSSQQSATTLCG